MKQPLKIFDGDEIVVYLDQKAAGQWRGHLYDTCCDCGLRHHNIFRVTVGKKRKPELSIEIYTDTVGNRLNKPKARVRK